MAARKGFGSLASISTAELAREMARRQAQASKLVERRNKLAKELAELDRELSAFGMAGPSAAPAVSSAASAPAAAPRKRGRPLGSKNKVKAGGPRKRPKNDMNLAEALAKVLKGTTMGVTEVTSAVQKAGYKTSAENFRTIVNQTLIRDARFKKVSRGQYTAA